MFLLWTIRKLRQLGVPWSVIGGVAFILFVYFMTAVVTATAVKGAP